MTTASQKIRGMPEELKQALSKNKRAKEKFDKFTPSKKKMLYRGIIRAKLPETRKRRIEKIIELDGDDLR